jgi:hypothetical protein
MKALSRRMMLWAAAMGTLFASHPAQAAATGPSPRDIDAMLDTFVVTEMAKRFAVLATRLGAPDRAKAEEATADFADAVNVIYRARQHAHDVLLHHQQKGQ